MDDMIECTESDTKITVETKIPVEFTEEITEIPEIPGNPEKQDQNPEQYELKESLEPDLQQIAVDDHVDHDVDDLQHPTITDIIETETQATDNPLENPLPTTTDTPGGVTTQEVTTTETTTTTTILENTEEPTNTYTEEIQTPEYLQKKLYFLLEQLKIMHSELPESYQMRIPYELLTGLANSLINNTIFEIVKRLMEIQHVTENHLQQLRHQVETEHQIEIQEWLTKISDTEELEHIVKMMKIKHANKLKDTDMKLVLHLDQKVHDQQTTLERAGVPGFYGTDSPKAIKIQMHLLDFILRLSRMKFEPK